MKLVTLSSKNQISLPKSLLAAVGMQPQGKFIIELGKKQLILKPVPTSIIKQTAGSLARLIPISKRKRKLAEIMQTTKEETAKKLARSV